MVQCEDPPHGSKNLSAILDSVSTRFNSQFLLQYLGMDRNAAISTKKCYLSEKLEIKHSKKRERKKYGITVFGLNCTRSPTSSHEIQIIHTKILFSHRVGMNLERSPPSFQMMMMMMFQVVWTFPPSVVWDDCNCFPQIALLLISRGPVVTPLCISPSRTAQCAKKAIWLSGVRGVDSQSKAVASPDGTREERIDNEWLSAARLSARQRFTGPQQTRNRCDCVTGSCTQCSDILLSESCVNSWALSICFQRWRE